MARPIDEKIVAMKMDNSDFKRKAAETTSLFGKLTNALNKIPGVDLSKISKSFDGIQRSADKVDMTGLSNNVSGVAGQFSKLQIVATTALATIASKATTVGMGLAHDLGIGQVASGFREYETKIGATNTMLFNTQWENTTLDDVKKTLAELNTYADKTVYSFEEMTRSIGRFTTAGVSLDESATAIKGLGNLAALSGASGEQYNRALYQASQALQGDYFMAIDWNSIEEAGMGGKYTKDALMETAEGMGMVIDKSVPFRQSLKDGWLTSEVFIETMRKFGDDKAMVEAATKVRTFTQFMTSLKEGIGSGWAQSWEIMIGDFEEATKRWTAISDFFTGIFHKQAEQRNKLLRGIFENGGLDKAFEGLKNVVKPIGQIFGAIGDGFRKAFPPMSAKGVLNLMDAFIELTDGLELSESSVKNLSAIFEGFFSIFAIGWKIIKGAVSIVLALIPSFSGLGSKILELVARVARIPTAFNDASDSSEAFGAAIGVLKAVASGIATVLEYVVDGLIMFTDVIAEVYSILVKRDFSGVGPWSEDSKIVDKLFKIRDAVVDVADGIASAWGMLTKGEFSEGGPWEKDSQAVKWMTNIGNGLKKVGNAILDLEFSLEPITSAFSTFFSALKDGYNWVANVFSSIGDKIQSMLPSGGDLFAGGFIAALATIVGFSLKAAWDFHQIVKGWAELGPSVTGLMENLAGAFNGFTWQLRVNALLTAAIAIGVLAASFWVMGRLDQKQIVTVTYGLVGALMALVGALAIMTKYDITGTGLAAVAQIIGLSIAFGILSIALRSISNMDWNEIAKGLVGLAGTMGVFVGSLTLMSKYGGKALAGTMTQFIGIALSMLILVQVLKQLGEMDWKKRYEGIAGLVATLAVFIGALTLMSKYGGAQVAASSLQFIALAASILIIVEAIRQIGDIDPMILEKGMWTIAAILGGVAAFTALTSEKGLLATGAGLVLLAAAMNMLVIPIFALAQIDSAKLVKGLGAMGFALAAIGAASMLMKDLAKTGAGLILLAIGINMLVGPIAIFAAMPIKALAVGIGALALGILAIGGAAMLLGMASAPLLLGALAITALGVALLAGGAGLALFSTALVTLATMSAAAITTIVATLGTLITGLFSLIPKAVEFIAKFIISMIVAITERIPTVVGKFMELVTELLNAIAERVPEFVIAATNLIIKFLGAMEEQIPKVIEAAANLMVALALAIEQNGPKFINAWLSIMSQVTLLMVQAGLAVIQALFGWIPGVTEATTKIGNRAEESIKTAFNAAKVGTDKGTDFNTSLSGTAGGARGAGSVLGGAAEVGAGTANLSSVGSGKGLDFSNALSGTSGAVWGSGSKLGKSAEDGSGTANLSPIGSDHGYDFADGLSGTDWDAENAGLNIAGAGKDGAGSLSMSSEGTNFGLGFAGGIDSQSVMSSVWSAGKAIARAAKNAVAGWLDINSPSRVAFKDGEWFGKGLALGIANKAREVGDKARGLAMTAKESLNKFLDGFQLPEDDNELHFKAVVDYETLDTRKFGKLDKLGFAPDTSLTNSLVSATRAERYAREPEPKRETKETESKNDKRPSIIQVVTPDKREMARWMVDDITEFQNFKMVTTNEF